MSNMIPQVKEALVIFLEALNELEIPHGALAFDDRVDVVKDFSKNATLEERARMLPMLKARGSTDDLAALQAAAQMLDDSSADRRIIIFLTDGDGNGTRLLR